MRPLISRLAFTRFAEGRQRRKGPAVQDQDQPICDTDVRVTGVLGEWFVTVREQSREPVVQSFLKGNMRSAMLKGQRIRLGVE